MSDSRLAYLDGLRGAALVLMVVNHTARWWIDGHMTWPRYSLIYITQTLAAPTFLFLVGFCLPLGRSAGSGAPESLGTLAWRFVPRGMRIVLAGAGYVAFVLAFPALTRFVAAHERLGLILFFDYPPWPWLSLVLIGLVLGSTWLQTHRHSPQAGARYLAVAAAVGAVMVVAFFVYDWWAATPMRFGMRRDFILNRHWTPRGAALLWVLGMVLLMLAAAYWAMERRRWRLPWLVILGQTALFLYFFHQIIAYTLVKKWLGWHFDAWPWFWLANAVFVAVLIAVGWAWREIKRRRLITTGWAWREIKSRTERMRGRTPATPS